MFEIFRNAFSQGLPGFVSALFAPSNECLVKYVRVSVNNYSQWSVRTLDRIRCIEDSHHR
jgi:hypothetical protein